MDHGFENQGAGSVSLGQMFGVIRRRYRFVLTLVLLGLAGGGFLVYNAPAKYKASATLRLAGERRALTGQIEGPTPEIARTTDPLLSLVQLVQSRNVLGAVVDSLGLRLTSATEDFGANQLDSIHVEPLATSDTILVTFYRNGVKAKLGDREARAAYGERMDLGTVQFSVPSVPDVPVANLSVIPREKAVDNLVADIEVIQRPGTDIIDVSYSSQSPRAAQRLVNTTLLSFQELNILGAKQRSQRRRQFLEEQLKQTDSMLEERRVGKSVWRV